MTVCGGVGVAGEGLAVAKEIETPALVAGMVVGCPTVAVELAGVIKLGELTVGEATELLQLIKTKEMAARKVTLSFELGLE